MLSIVVVNDIVDVKIDVNQTSKDIFNQRLKYQRETTDVIVFVNVKIKIYYDFRHQIIFFRFDERVYLRLNHDYKLLDWFNRKMFNQKCDFFTIKRRVKRLTYELNLSTHWRVHSMISMTQLKSSFNEKNFYNRSRFNYFETMKIKNDTKNWKFYIVERVVDKRLRKFEQITIIQYLIKWNDYDSKFNEWRSLFYLNNCMNLMKKFEARQLTKKKSSSTSMSKSAESKSIMKENKSSSMKRERERSRKID